MGKPISLFVETNTTRDQFTDATGLFINEFCLLGANFHRDNHGTWLFMVIFFNIAAGIWNGERDD